MLTLNRIYLWAFIMESFLKQDYQARISQAFSMGHIVSPAFRGTWFFVPPGTFAGTVVFVAMDEEFQVASTVNGMEQAFVVWTGGSSM
jgi:hypothetical protein